MKEESKVYNTFWDAIPKDKQPPKDTANKEVNNKKPEPSKPQVAESKAPKRRRKPRVAEPRPQESRPQRLPNKRPFQSTYTAEERRRGNVSWNERRQQQQRYENQRHNDQSFNRSFSSSQDRSFMEDDRYNERGRMQDNGRGRMQEDRYFERDRMDRDGYGRQDNSSQFHDTLFDTGISFLYKKFYLGIIQGKIRESTRYLNDCTHLQFHVQNMKIWIRSESN